MAIPTLTPTLDPFSTKPKESTPMGGGVGFFDENEAAEAAGRFINNSLSTVAEIGSATGELFREIAGIRETKQETVSSEEQKLTIGGQTEHVFNDADKIEHQKAQAVIQRYAEIDQSIKQVSQDRVQKLAKDIERISGGEFSVLDVATESQSNVTKPGLDSTEFSEISINTALLVWDERQQKLKLATNPKPNVATSANLTSGFQMGENELQLGGENRSHFTSSPA